MKKFLIQPCCCKRHLLELRNVIGTNGTAEFYGYEDLSLTELLPAIMTRYSETEMMIVAPSIPDQAAEVIAYWMRKKNAVRTGPGSVDVISRLTILADLNEKKSPKASVWLHNNPFEDRLVANDVRQRKTVILLPDFAITGPVNMRYGRKFTAAATTEKERIDELWRNYRELTKTTGARKESEPPTDGEVKEKKEV